MTHHQLILGVGGLAAIGLLVLLAGARRRARNAAEDAVRTASLVGRVLIGAAVIAGAQLAVIRFAHNNIPLMVCAFAVPALLAAATAVKALTVTTISTSRRGHRR